MIKKDEKKKQEVLTDEYKEIEKSLLIKYRDNKLNEADLIAEDPDAWEEISSVFRAWDGFDPDAE